MVIDLLLRKRDAVAAACARYKVARLDAFGRLAGGVDKADAQKQALLVRLKTQAQAAMANMPRLLAAAPG